MQDGIRCSQRRGQTAEEEDGEDAVAMTDDHESTESVQTEDDVEWERMEYVRCNRLPLDYLDGWTCDQLKGLDDDLREADERNQRWQAERRALKAKAKAKQMPTPKQIPSPMPKPKQTPTMPKTEKRCRFLEPPAMPRADAKAKPMPKASLDMDGRITVVLPGDPDYATDSVPWSVCSRCGVYQPFALIMHPTCTSLLGVECTYDEYSVLTGEAQQQQPYGPAASSSEGWCP